MLLAPADGEFFGDVIKHYHPVPLAFGVGRRIPIVQKYVS